MSWLIVAIAARFIEGSSALADKRLLSKSYPNAFGYAFWEGIFEALVIVLIPFGFHWIPLTYVLVAFASGAFFVFGAFFYLSALFRGEVSSTNTLLGALTPVATLILSAILIGIGLQTYQAIAFIFLVTASFLLFLSEKKELRLNILAFVVLGAVCFGLSSTLAKIVFLHTNFISGFVTIKIGGALSALSFLAIPSMRKRIISSPPESRFTNRTGYFLNRAYAGIGSILVYYSIFLSNPALVDATAAIRYVVVFLGGWLLLKEIFRGKTFILKIAALVLALIGVVWIAGGDYMHATAPDPTRPVVWGVTFSEKFSEMIGHDWKQNYDAILGDLGVKHLRLIAYWDLIEKQRGVFDFADLDYQMNKAVENGASVILAVGQKVPRWPECHKPDWIQGQTSEAGSQSLLDYIGAVVGRYKNSPALLYWQVENEPFLPFGDCPTANENFLRKEISLVKSLDSAHKILTTDGGEFGLWYPAAKLGDAFGTTMYRRVHNRIFGYTDYRLPPEFFRLKEKIVRSILGDQDKKFMVIELGAEPWLEHQLYETTVSEQLAKFDLPFFKNTVDYAKAAGFGEYYLWGAEWWYWMKQNQSHPEFWDYAKTLLNRR